jgi:long-chain acyl-CoA synthetase
MPVWLLEYFESLGLPVFEAYGVSENIVPVAMNRPGQRKLGTVGKPMPPNDVTLAADGEILVRGPGVFEGYWSAERVRTGAQPDSDGYWHTGDLGSLDEDGYLRVAGRKSEMFKTSGGRWIEPSQIEARLRQIPYVDQAVVVGTGKKAIVALLCLRQSPASLLTPEVTDKPASPSGLSEEQESQLRADVAAEVSDLAEHQRPAGLLIVRGAFTIDGGELTTNLKLRRKAVEAKYSEEIERTFAALDGAAIPVLETRSPTAGIPVIQYA